MPTPFPTRPARPSGLTGSAKHISANSDWRCTRCKKLLGVYLDGRMHLRFARGHEYLVGLPVTATCRGCRTLNEISAPGAAEPSTAQSR